MRRFQWTVAEAVTGAVTMAAVNALPPLIVDAFGHTLMGLGRGMQRSGRAIEHAGQKTLEYADDQRERNAYTINGPQGPEFISVGGARYRKIPGRT